MGESAEGNRLPGSRASSEGPDGRSGGRRHRVRTAVTGVAGVLVAIALGFAVGALLSSGGGGSARSTVNQQSVARTTLATTHPRQPSSAATPERASSTDAGSSRGARILAALQKYWADIRTHDFVAAFGYLVPGAVDLTEGEFISEQKRLGVKSASFKGAVSASTSQSATVGVVSLLTRDREHGCRTWSGSYALVVEDGFWRILREALTPRRCD